VSACYKTNQYIAGAAFVAAVIKQHNNNLIHDEYQQTSHQRPWRTKSDEVDAPSKLGEFSQDELCSSGELRSSSDQPPTTNPR
jgi:hypothetical protein